MAGRQWTRTAAAAALVGALVLGGCSGGGDDAATSGGDAVDASGGDDRSVRRAGDGDDGGTPPTTTAAMPSAESGSGAAADEAVPVPPEEGLRAGSVDDNDDPAGFVEYLDRIAGLGVTTRPFDAEGRVLVTVADEEGAPAAGVEVVVTDGGGEAVATLRTTADGTARLYPGLYDSQADDLRVAVGDGPSLPATPGTTVALTAGGGLDPSEAVPLDILFLLDATGSMADEIDRLKTTIDSVAARIDELPARPDVRFAITEYRDEGEEEFVTRTHDFTADVAAFRSTLADVVADGGGDYPEALDEGLAEALAAPSWRPAGEAVQLVFLVADAPPHVDRDVDVTYVESALAAAGRGVKVFPIASSEADDQAEAVFRQVAAVTGARFVFLSYGAGGAATGGNTDIASTDYEELPLDALVVRLVTEELTALTGTAPTPDPEPTDPTPPTNPPGQ